ncbi:MAG: hypothetical protein ACT443_10405 [Gemmatimonadota bacterium]
MSDARGFRWPRLDRPVEALTIGATDIADAEASFSNHGPCVDMLAPGVAITLSLLRNAVQNTITLHSRSVNNGTPNKFLLMRPRSRL